MIKKVIYTLSIISFFYLTIMTLLGKTNIFTIILLCTIYSVLILNLFLFIILKIFFKISEKIYANKIYINYCELFEYLKHIHKTRYKLYFSGVNKDIEIYSKEIENCGNVILDLGVYLTESNNKLMKSNQISKIQEIIEQTKYLMVNIH